MPSKPRRYGRAVDTALVLAVALAGLLGVLVQSRGIDTAAEWAALAAVLVSAGVLAVRRRYPVPVGAVALAAVVAYGVLLDQPGPIMLAFVVALYTVVDAGYLAVAIGLGAASVAAFALADGFDPAAGTANGATLLNAGWVTP